MLRDNAAPAQTILLAAGATVSAGGWDFISYNLPQAGVFNWSGVTQLAYTALDAPGLAAASCGIWRDNDPKARLDPVVLSPKIMAACAKGQP